MRTTTKGLVVWDLGTDNFSHTQLAANWDLIESLITVAKSIQTSATVPGSGNFAGRVIFLTAPDGGFQAGSVIVHDGTSWGIIGGFAAVNTGGGASNISGLTTSGDVQISNSARGFILVDRASATKYRLYFQGGQLYSEVVS